ncbi:DUF3465 domain-containing protein [Candidatus Omnitrophota bacterium]
MRKFHYFVFLIFIFLSSAYSCSPAPAQTFDTSFEDYNDLAAIEQAFRNRETKLFVASTGIVEWILDDDLKRPRHQRFIIRLANDQTLLVLYNIDLAPRIKDLQPGERIMFRGEYLWNEKGGALHWTHRDPANRIIGGWIEHRGEIYR